MVSNPTASTAACSVRANFPVDRGAGERFYKEIRPKISGPYRAKRRQAASQRSSRMAFGGMQPLVKSCRMWSILPKQPFKFEAQIISQSRTKPA